MFNRLFKPGKNGVRASNKNKNENTYSLLMLLYITSSPSFGKVLTKEACKRRYIRIIYFEITTDLQA